MENASKALLITASVLIAILLIAFAIRILNSGQGTEKSLTDTMTATEKAMFNNKFVAYFGNNIQASKVKELINVIITNNATSEHKVKYDGTSDETELTSKMASLSGNKKITPTYENGIVTAIKVEDAGN